MADLAVTVTDDADPISVGSAVTYSSVVSNYGPGIAKGNVFYAVLPPNVEYVSASAGCIPVPGYVYCPMPDLAPGATHDVSVEVRALEQGLISFTVYAIGDTSDPYLQDNIATEETTVVAPN